MPRLSDSQIAAAVKAAGFPRESWATAIAVALAESGGNSDAVNRANSNGSIDHGLFQINSVHKELLNSGDWRDPVYNAKMAFAISSGGANWRPWVAYTTGRHLPFLPRGKKAAGEPVGSAPPAALPTGISLGGAKDFFGLIADPKTWLRLGYFIVGGLLLLIAFSQITGVSRFAGGPLAVASRIKGAK